MRWNGKTVRTLIVLAGAAVAALAMPLTALANMSLG
jgi:hypothetical protein